MSATTTGVRMTDYELILAHQACLDYMFTNFKAPFPATGVLVGMVNPSTPQGLCLCRTIAKKLGRRITQDDARQIEAYI